MNTERFDKAASEWDSKSRRVLLAGKISNAILKLPLTKEMDALEYGCGTGLVGIAISQVIKKLTAIDNSRGMLEVLEKKISTEDLKNIRTLCCDLLTENYTEKHHLIFCSMTLHHIKDAKGLLQRFADILLPGGYIAIADLVTEDGTFHDTDAEGIHHDGFTPEELAAVLSCCGLEDISHRIVHTITKGGINKKYPIFLLTARKPS